MAFIDRMAGQDYIDQTRAYLVYLEEHLENVRKAFNHLSKVCEGMAWVGDDCAWHTLRMAVEGHDLSKFSKEEFTQYRESFYPVRGEIVEGKNFDAAWKNHKEMNRHHHETIKDSDCLDIVHMAIDWTAMSYKFGGTAQSYYESKKEPMELSDDNEKFLYEIFNKIQQGNRNP